MISNQELKEILEGIENDRDYLLACVLSYTRFELKEIRYWTKRDYIEKIKDPFTAPDILRNKKILRYVNIIDEDCLIFESNKQGSLSKVQCYRIFYSFGITTKQLKKYYFYSYITKYKVNVFSLEVLARLSKKTLYEMFRFAEIAVEK
jgi:hypothetical protein